MRSFLTPVCLGASSASEALKALLVSGFGAVSRFGPVGFGAKECVRSRVEQSFNPTSESLLCNT